MSENQTVPTDAQAAGVPTPANPAQTAEVATAGTETEGAAGPTKGELKRRAKEAEKAKKAAERAAKEEEEKKKREAAASVDNASQNYGKLPLHQSQERNGGLHDPETTMQERALIIGRKFLKFQGLTKEDVGTPVIFRARMHNMRPQGQFSLSRVRNELMSRGQDCLFDFPTTNPHPPRCSCCLWREGRAPSLETDAQVCSDYPGKSTDPGHNMMGS